VVEKKNFPSPKEDSVTDLGLTSDKSAPLWTPLSSTRVKTLGQYQDISTYLHAWYK
jgi:hypothetical protein